MAYRPGQTKAAKLANQAAKADLSDLLAIADGAAPLPGEDEHSRQERQALQAAARGYAANLTETQPRLIEWLRWPIEDRAYQLYLRGYTMRAIGRELACDKDTANKFVLAARREQEPVRRENRTQWLAETIDRLRNVQTHAWGQWDQCGEPALLTIITVAEREIAKLRGLYDVLAEDDGGNGVTIRIMRRESGLSALNPGMVMEADTVDGASDDDE